MLIFHVEDDPISQDQVRQILHAQRYDVVTFSHASDVLGHRRIREVDAIVIDYKLPGGPSGMALASQIIEHFPHMVVIMVSSFAEKLEIRDAFRLGIDDFLIKPFAPHELINSLGKALMRRNIDLRMQAPETASRESLVLDPETRTVLWYGQPLKLTPLEYAILVQLTAKPGRVFTCAELYALVKGEHVASDLARARLKSHITHLRQKIAQGGRYPQAIQNVHSVGFRWSPPEPDGNTPSDTWAH